MLWFNLELVVERQEKWKYSTKQGGMRFPRIFHAGILCEKLCTKKENLEFFPRLCGKFCGECGKEVEYEKGQLFLRKMEIVCFPERFVECEKGFKLVFKELKN